MLYNENEVTNEIILNNQLVAIIMDNNDRVNVIKNDYNEVLGIIPIDLYCQLEDDFEKEKETKQNLFDKIIEEIKKQKSEEAEEAKKTREQSEQSEQSKETNKDAFDYYFDGVEEISEEIFGAFDSIFEDFSEAFGKVKPAVKDIKRDIKIGAEIIKLKSLRENAIEADVATKGFLKKIDKKLAAYGA